jgi:hypothetical protein
MSGARRKRYRRPQSPRLRFDERVDAFAHISSHAGRQRGRVVRFPISISSEPGFFGRGGLGEEARARYSPNTQLSGLSPHPTTL